MVRRPGHIDALAGPPSFFGLAPGGLHRQGLHKRDGFIQPCFEREPPPHEASIDATDFGWNARPRSLEHALSCQLGGDRTQRQLAALGLLARQPRRQRHHVRAKLYQGFPALAFAVGVALALNLVFSA